MGWFAVDLDGTLAEYHGFVDPYTIGKPIPKMIERVHSLLHLGIEVRIFTARIDPKGLEEYRRRTGDEHATPENVKAIIEDWTRTHIGRTLLVTDRKDLETEAIWDDRAFHVILNTGMLQE